MQFLSIFASNYHLYISITFIMIVNPNKNIHENSDIALVEMIGNFVKHTRIAQRKTQDDLATIAGLNRWTISQIEKGQTINLRSLIQVLRALDQLQVLEVFLVKDEIGPIEYAKMMLRNKPKKRVRKSAKTNDSEEEIGW
ncbi:MAG: helix-turn-helix domain-containing protein [Flavobacteriales bacterium]